MATTMTLSEAALCLLRLRLAGERCEVTPGNLEAYRELTRAGVMYPVSGFLGGPEASFRFTEDGWRRREEWISAAAPQRSGSP